MNSPVSTRTRVVLADDHALMREGLARLLSQQADIHVVAECGSGHHVLEVLRRMPVDVVVTDLSMPGLPPMDLIRRIRAEFERVAVLVLTMHAEDHYATRAFRAGASGFITKDSTAEQLLTALRRVAAGGAYVSAGLAERLAMGLARSGHAPRHESLSEREFEVFRHLVCGLRMTDIALQMHLSVKTVSTHKARIMQKLGVASMAALVRYGLEHSLFDQRLSGYPLPEMAYEQMRLPLHAN